MQLDIDFKKLAVLFGAGTLGVLVSLVMSVTIAIQRNRAERAPTPITIPLPATL